jgi:hypothetical protein
VEELIFYLKSTGQTIPGELLDKGPETPLFRPPKNCWEYWSHQNGSSRCQNCIVFHKNFELCFVSRVGKTSDRASACTTCSYYQETYHSRIQFIHQIEMPCAVYRDLFILGGNGKMSQILDVPEEDLVGIGIEKIIHPSSLPQVIGFAKRRFLGDPTIPNSYTTCFQSKKGKKIEAMVSIFPLSEPKGAFLVIGDPV